MKEDEQALENSNQEEEMNTENTSEEIQDENKNPIEDLELQLKGEKDKYVRLYAEFDNYRKRTGKERLDLIKSANESLMQALLPVMDDFNRAMPQIENVSDEETIKGVSLIRAKLAEILKNKGLKAIEVKMGDSFDPETQEAITQIDAPSEDLKGKVVDVIESGYSLNDKIIRFPKVVVGK